MDTRISIEYLLIVFLDREVLNHNELELLDDMNEAVERQLQALPKAKKGRMPDDCEEYGGCPFWFN